MSVKNKILSSILPAGLYQSLKRRYVRYKLFGFKYKCPFCNGSFRMMFPAGKDYPIFKEKKIIGAGPRDNIRCPYCNSSTRERAFLLYLKEHTNNFSDQLEILHVAPEKNLQKLLKSRGNVNHTSIDLDSPLADIKMDVCDIKFDDNSFDIIICSHVLEHVPDDIKAMSEFYRVLKTGGFAILQVPIAIDEDKTFEKPYESDPEERIRLFGQDDHVRLYGADYKDRLESVGFKVSKYNFDLDKGREFATKYALDLKEDLYICTKNS